MVVKNGTKKNIVLFFLNMPYENCFSAFVCQYIQYLLEEYYSTAPVEALYARSNLCDKNLHFLNAKYSIKMNSKVLL